jgi:hypothetical protein
MVTTFSGGDGLVMRYSGCHGPTRKKEILDDDDVLADR